MTKAEQKLKDDVQADVDRAKKAMYRAGFDLSEAKNIALRKLGWTPDIRLQCPCNWTKTVGRTKTVASRETALSVEGIE